MPRLVCCLHAASFTLFASITRFVQTESPDYRQLLPFWACLLVNRPAFVGYRTMFGWLLLSGGGPAAEEDSIDTDRVCIGRRWQRVGQSQQFLVSLCIFYERPAEQTVVFLLVVRQTAYFEIDFRRVIVASLNSCWCRASMSLVRWRSVGANRKRNKDLSRVCPWFKKKKNLSLVLMFMSMHLLCTQEWT